VERASRDCVARLAALREARENAAGELAAVRERLGQARAALAELPASDHLDQPVAEAGLAAQKLRDERAVTGARIEALEQERQRRDAQMHKLREDLARWTARAEQGAKQIEALKVRLAETEAEHTRVAGVPDQLGERRQRLLDELTEAESSRRSAADALAEAENSLKESTAALRTAQAEVSEQREFRARADARLEAARIRRGEVVRAIQESFDTNPAGCLAIAEVEDSGALPSVDDAEGRLQRLRADRERLGGVNLQAGAELDALSEQHATLDGERADVEEAIAKLRAGIASLNREGRRRLKEAFETVNDHFSSLFTTLFDGGEARLELLDDNDDPLAGGLEIIAKPPGKKPTTLSLLSGGEQSLTALSLIFAVFLTNPSPICVLDEVDAPLDDANVDRFCNLMERMASETDTRFLVITHHPMTMARVDRLFGVTMVERGVSQLVSVDLTTAEEFLEAG
ncbi:MAG: chromosome segregation protein SMC, partial [Hyphomicrobiaceae bacterium]